MPKKLDPDSTYGEKIISLFAELLFTGKPKSQKELADLLKCAPQTVRRLLDSITNIYHFPLMEEKRGKTNVFWIERPEKIHMPPMSSEEIVVLEMGRAFSKNLLGEGNCKAAKRGLQKSLGMLSPREAKNCADKLGALSNGRIDYTPFTEMLKTLVEASYARKVCEVKYKSLEAESAREFCVMPLKIFSHKDTIYIHCRRCTRDGLVRLDDEFDPLLALHRFKDVKAQDRTFDFPKDFDFEKSFARSFGVIKDEPFKVRVEFAGWSAAFVSERVWSPDQKMVRKRDGKIELEFSASSECELIGWVLSFGDEARIVMPERLRKRIVEVLRSAVARYES
jgi:predicted DNA-binding transcriptional regulator YafY